MTKQIFTTTTVEKPLYKKTNSDLDLEIVETLQIKGQSSRIGIGFVSEGKSGNKIVAGGATERVAGPWAYTYGLPAVLSAHPVPVEERTPTYIVEDGDEITVDGNHYIIKVVRAIYIELLPVKTA